MRIGSAVVASLVLASSAAFARADTVIFVPDNDGAGQVFSTNNNDGYDGGRGVVFVTTNDITLTDVAIFQDLTAINLFYEVAETITTSGTVTGGQTILQSGSNVTTTSGLQFVNFSFTPLQLLAGHSYHVNFAFTGNSNQNFFYDEGGSPSYSQTGFTFVDGTASGDTGNTVVPRIQLTFTATAPEPGTMALFGLGGLGLAGVAFRRRRRARLAAAAK